MQRLESGRDVFNDRLTDQCNVIRGWLNLGSDVYSDTVVTSWDSHGRGEAL
jgi:hypothetical protein